MSLNGSGHRNSDNFTIYSAISEGITDLKCLYFPQCPDVILLDYLPQIMDVLSHAALPTESLTQPLAFADHHHR
jgi:hypothetical protein